MTRRFEELAEVAEALNARRQRLLYARRKLVHLQARNLLAHSSLLNGAYDLQALLSQQFPKRWRFAQSEGPLAVLPRSAACSRIAPVPKTEPIPLHVQSMLDRQ